MAGRARVTHNTLLLFYSPKSFAFYISLLSKYQESLLFMLMFADRLFLPWGMRAQGNKLWECFVNFKCHGCLLLPNSIKFWNLASVAQFQEQSSSIIARNMGNFWPFLMWSVGALIEVSLLSQCCTLFRGWKGNRLAPKYNFTCPMAFPLNRQQLHSTLCSHFLR